MTWFKRLLLGLILLLPMVSQGAIGGVVSGSPSSGGISVGVQYVNAGADLGIAFSNLTHNTKLIIGPGTWTFQCVSNNDRVARPIVPLILANLTNVTIEGSGPATRLVGVGDGDLMAIQNCTNIVVRGFHMVRDQFPTGANRCARSYVLGLWGTNRFILHDRISAEGVPNLGWGNESPYSVCDDVTFLGCTMYNEGNTNSLAGVGPGGLDGCAIGCFGRNWLVADCVFSNCLRGVEMFLAAVPTPQTNAGPIIVRDCAFQKIIWEGVTTVGGDNGNWNQISVMGCRFGEGGLATNTTWTTVTNGGGLGIGVKLTMGRGHRIVNNTFNRVVGWEPMNTSGGLSQGCAIFVDGGSGNNPMTDVVIANNDIRNCKVGIQHNASAVSNVLVQGNTIVSNYNNGILLNNSGFTIRGNFIGDNCAGGGAGIQLGSGAVFNLVQDNYFFNSLNNTSQNLGVYVNTGASTNWFLWNRFSATTATPYTLNSAVGTIIVKLPLQTQTNMTYVQVGANSSTNMPVALKGVLPGDTATLSLPVAAQTLATACLTWAAFCSNDVVYIRCTNPTAAAVTPVAAVTYTVTAQ